jgi:hypothetical protein
LVGTKIEREIKALELDVSLAHYLRHAFGVTAADAGLAGLDPQAIRSRTFEALHRLLVAEARQRPLLVLIEDLHWIDRTSEDFLAEFASELSSVPIMLLVTYRPGYSPPWTGKSFTSQLALRPLSPAASEMIVISMLDRGDPAATAAIAERGEGNPFFLEELARATRDQAANEEGAAVPETVQQVLAARIDRLSSDQKAALQMAAVLGRELSLDLAEEVWDGDVLLEARLQELKGLEFLLERHGPAEQRASFLISMTGFLLRRDRYHVTAETVEVARAANAAAQEAAPSPFWWAVFELEFVLHWHGDLDEATLALRESLAEAERRGDVMTRSRALTYLMVAGRKRGDVEEVRHAVSPGHRRGTRGIAARIRGHGHRQPRLGRMAQRRRRNRDNRRAGRAPHVGSTPRPLYLRLDGPLAPGRRRVGLPADRTSSRVRPQNAPSPTATTPATSPDTGRGRRPRTGCRPTGPSRRIAPPRGARSGRPRLPVTPGRNPPPAVQPESAADCRATEQSFRSTMTARPRPRSGCRTAAWRALFIVLAVPAAGGYSLPVTAVAQLRRMGEHGDLTPGYWWR